MPKAKKAIAASPKRATWDLTSFDELESWRESQGHSKSAVARMLGLGNSSYHNWRHSAPGINIQRKLRALIDGTVDALDPKTTLSRDRIEQVAQNLKETTQPESSREDGVSEKVELAALKVTRDILRTYLAEAPHTQFPTPKDVVQFAGCLQQALLGDF